MVNPLEVEKYGKGNLNLNPAAIYDDAEKMLGHKVEDLLGDEFVFTKLEGIADAAALGKLPEFMARLRKELSEHLDELAEKEVADFAGWVTNKVAAERELGVANVYNMLIDDLWAGHMDYALHMQLINDKLADITTPAMKDKFWKEYKAATRHYWDKQYERFDGAVKGMRKGAAQAEVQVPEDVEKAITRIKNGWSKLHRKHDAELDKIFAARLKGKVPEKTIRHVQDEMDAAMLEMTEIEARMYTQVDEAIGNMIPDKTMRDAFRKYRSEMARIRGEDKAAVVQLRRTIEGLSPERQRAEHLKF